MKNMKKRPGYTLVELITVIVIIAVLMAGAGVMFADYVGRAKYATAESDLGALKAALDQYAINHNGTFIGLFTNGRSTGDLTGSNMLNNMDKLGTYLTNPLSELYDPWQRPYLIWADYNSTTNQSDVVIYVEADTTLGLNAKQVDYKSVSPNGTETTFSVTNVAVNPLRKPKGAAGTEGSPMALRVSGQYEMQ
jgi:prepilin-type N-terminal cleavage/methylation domain-containing protein